MNKSRVTLCSVVFSSLFLALARLPGSVRASEPDALDLQTVWERVRRSGAYHFRADLTQTTENARPATITYGPSTWESRVHMEG